MKKTVTLSLALALAASVYADNVKVLGCGQGVPGVDEPQLMGLGISPNGHYVCGPIENGAGFFAADVQTGEVKWTLAGDEGGELRHIDNSGLAVGFTDWGVTYDFATGEVTVLDAPAGFRYILCEDITEDGTMFVGSMVGQTFETKAAYCKDGKTWQALPVPTQADLGEFANSISAGSAAKYVSADGKVILGCLGSFTIPVLWTLNDKGEYEADFFPARFVKTGNDEAGDNAKPLYSISAMYLNMSNNGKYLSMLGMVFDAELDGYLNVPVIYNTESKEAVVYTGLQAIDENKVGLYPTAVCDDGTFIGTIGQPFFGEYGCFIMKAGKTVAEKYIDAFPAFKNKFGESDALGFNIPTGMSADGSYLLGYSFYSEDYNSEASDAYYVTYVIDVNGDAAVDNVQTDETAVPVAFYGIDGRRLGKMTKGINIVRMSDGTTRKVINR